MGLIEAIMGTGLTRKAANRVKSRIRIEPSGCWSYVGCVDTSGHHCVMVNGVNVRVHRLMFDAHNPGIMQPGRKMVVHQACLNRGCVNPEHLVYVDKWEADRRWNPHKGLSNKITTTMVQRIRSQGEKPGYKRGYAEIARQYGVSADTIRRILKMQTWRTHVQTQAA